METKMIRVPFEVELAKKITNGEVDGEIVTRNGESVRIVCFDRKDEVRPIIALVNRGDIEIPYAFCLNGKFVNDDILDTHDLMLEIPEYMTFKDGDVYTTITGGVGIYNSSYKSASSTIPFYVGMRNDGELIFRPNNDYAGFGSIKESRLSTEAEKQKLIDALKASKKPEAKECLKKLGIEVKQEYEFKPFDKVLVKDDYENSAWSCNLFSGKNEDGTYMCIGGYWDMCIPYNEQTAHLLGTTENYE